MKEKKVVVLSYTVPHRKTYDTLCRLRAKGYRNVAVYAKPYHYKKQYRPYIEHRPLSYGFDTKELCENLDYEYIEYDDIFPGIENGSTILIAGAGIISDEIVRNNTIINAHPGYIPDVRGLDAIKWAVMEDKPIGCTTHIVGEEVDAGIIIERKEIPIYKYDTFHALANRVYEYEIIMLVDAIEKKENALGYISGGDSVIHKRMPHEIEQCLLEKFESRKKNG